MLNNFRARLISQLGRAQANSEIKWMNQFIVDSTGPGAKATANTLRLEDLLRRRVGGEPLQYILGDVHPLTSKKSGRVSSLLTAVRVLFRHTTFWTVGSISPTANIDSPP